MPRLYGKPFKSTLRKEINRLRADNWKLQLEQMKPNEHSNIVKVKLRNLSQNLERIKAIAASIVSDIDTDVRPAVFERFKERMFG